MIRLSEVTKAYRSRRGPVKALDGVSLEVDTGEFVLVRGPSGSGKSTLLLAVGGMIRPSAGKVMVDDVDLYTLDNFERAWYRARRVGFVFQMFHLVPYLSVLDNVLLPTRLAPSAEARTRAVGLLERFGMATRLTHKPAELSTGERKRTAMARALVNRPQMVLADEPTGNLDPDNAALILGYLTEFHRGGGTVIVVSHDPACEPYATRTVRLSAGSLDGD